MHAKLYEVWFSTGTGTHIGPRFKLLEDAIRFVNAHTGDASYAIRAPGGEWALVERRHADVEACGRPAVGREPYVSDPERTKTRPRIARGTGSPSSR